MHKRFGITVALLFVAALVIIPGLLDECATFILIGVLPYTSIQLPSTAILVIYALLLALGVYTITSGLFTATNPVKREVASREHARRRVHKIVKTPKVHAKSRPKKRYQTVVER